MTGVCPTLDDDVFSMTSANVTAGSDVNVTCRAFGYRVVGAKSLTCSNVTFQWDPDLPKCEWTWEFTTQEKVVLGTAVGCAALIILILIVTLTAFCICRRRRQEKHREYNDADNAGYDDGSPGDTGGIYPDAYFAYQDVGNKHDMNGLPGTLDRAWLGYIPRPKVAEGPYYQ